MTVANLLDLRTGWPRVPALAGLPGGAAAWAIAAKVKTPTLVVTGTEAEAIRLANEVAFHLRGAAPVAVMPSGFLKRGSDVVAQEVRMCLFVGCWFVPEPFTRKKTRPYRKRTK